MYLRVARKSLFLTSREGKNCQRPLANGEAGEGGVGKIFLGGAIFPVREERLLDSIGTLTGGQRVEKEGLCLSSEMFEK